MCTNININIDSINNDETLYIVTDEYDIIKNNNDDDDDATCEENNTFKVKTASPFCSLS